MTYSTGNAPTALSSEKRRARAVALHRRIVFDSGGFEAGTLDLADFESFVKRFAAKFRSDMTEADAANLVASYEGNAVTEGVFADYVCTTYKDIGNEEFFSFLDFMDSPSYFKRVRYLRNLFWKIDTDGSGYLETDELRRYIKQ